METIAKIRRLSLVQGKSIKAICRELKISRKVVRKVLRSEETEFRYERKHQPYSRMGAWRETLDRLLSANAAKPQRERLTLIRIFEELRGLGYDGSYSSGWRHAQSSAADRGSAVAEAYIPLSFAPGEAYQFDWSHEIVLLDGVTVKVAHMRLSQPHVLREGLSARDAEDGVRRAYRAFAFFRGACTRGIYDNMKTAVDAIFIGRDRRYSRRFAQMCGHYLVEPEACTPAAGWEKGQVENQVGLVRERFFTPRLRFKTLEDLNGWLDDKCVA
ncbi:MULTISPECIES: IS21 family transposase [Mesorhizobium]|uniref:IS21 family transposase n=1 Tax=Mesorhizobium ciceri TaxID=39645 RepID=A0AB38TEQ3_9HYPH|nr:MULTISPECIES: IS21 family transposase [Mesorhizobium]UTU53189.1 IS21 family transposase [Mesorhizobium ciceri]